MAKNLCENAKAAASFTDLFQESRENATSIREVDKARNQICFTIWGKTVLDIPKFVLILYFRWLLFDIIYL